MSFDINLDELKALKENVEKLDTDVICLACAKELTARLLAKVVKRTPVGQYPHRVGGNLRRGWTGGVQKSVMEYVDGMHISRNGANYNVEIVNPVEYASYVEYGHRKANHTGWVEGKYMLTISENEIKASSQAIIEKKINNWLKEVLR